MLLDARSVALIAVFSALAISLNAIRIPAFLWPGMAYPIWEIPIVIAYFLFGFKIAVMVGAVNLVGQLAFFNFGPGFLVGFPVGFIALLVMLSGIYMANRIVISRASTEKPFGVKKAAICLTGFAVAFRAGIMPFIDYGVFYGILLPIVGIPIPDEYRAALIPVFILFNVTVPLYTVPIAYFVARRVRMHSRFEVLAHKRA